MISEVPFYDSHQPSDEPNKLEVPTSRLKAAFQWPSDCKWPFMDHESDSET